MKLSKIDIPFKQKIKRYFVQEATEKLVWAFLGYIIGISIYFSFPITTWKILPFIILGGFFWYYKRHFLIQSWILMAFFFVGLGMVNTSLQFELKKHPVLEKTLHQVQLTGEISSASSVNDRQQIVLNKIRWDNSQENLPQKIKLTYLQKTPHLKVGDIVQLRANLFSPYTTFSPFSKDREYLLWFQKIGATGYTNHIHLIQEKQPSTLILSNLRAFIKERLFQILPKSQAQIMTALITGEQKIVTAEIYQLYQRAGIAHVLSVSGFHMALLAGFLFFIIQMLFCFFPKICLSYDSKKVAAVCAFLGTGFYLGLSDFHIPAIRAFLMISLVFLGILANRNVFSMRSLILVGFILLIIHPEFILSASFQLSFISVAVLICSCNWIQNQSWSKFKKSILGLFILNMAITVALTPFIVYHFNHWFPYAIFGNLLFSYLFSFFIMPMLFLGTLLIPFGLDKYPFYGASFFLDIIQKGIQKITEFPFDEISISGFQESYLFLIILGIFLLCLLRTPLKIIGGFVIFIGILLIVFDPRPDILITDSGKTLAFQKDSIFYTKLGSNSWQTKIWQQNLGKDKQFVLHENVFWIKGKKIALTSTQCTDADLAILNHPAPNKCKCLTLLPKEKEFFKIFIINGKFHLKRLTHSF